MSPPRIMAARVARLIPGNLAPVATTPDYSSASLYRDHPEICQQLVDAATRGDTDMVMSLLNPVTDPPSLPHHPTQRINDRGKTLLQLAAKHGHVALVTSLIDQGANADDIDEALLQAVIEKQVTTSQLLLDKGAANATDALIYAVRSGMMETTRLLLDTHGINVNAPNGTTSLMDANGGFSWISIAYLENGYGATPLMEAAKGGFTGIATLLLAHGADAKAKTEIGETALTIAAAKGHTAIVALLLPKEQSSAVRGNALICAVSSGWMNTTRLLLDSDSIDINTKSHDLTVLMFAARSGFTAIATLLLERGADATVMTERNETALTIAAAKGHTEVVALLLPKEQRTSVREAALKVAVENTGSSVKYAGIIALLLEDNRISSAALKSALQILDQSRDHNVPVALMIVPKLFERGVPLDEVLKAFGDRNDYRGGITAVRDVHASFVKRHRVTPPPSVLTTETVIHRRRVNLTHLARAH